MGVFIWHQWAQIVGIFASVCTIWGGLWGIFFRKFFWDFVNGTLMPGPNHAINGRKCFDDNPPAKQDAIFISLIVKAPVIQLFVILFGITHLAIELLPVIRRMSIYRSFALRIGTSGAMYSFVAVIGFTVAQMKGEIVEEAKEQRGRGDKA
ncbi:SubName: Full=Uncharacterized protein {ECO:0000313/EMBL:CCA76294.1} [Serendipita indica DSM 11827]|nr:SubName: Full=Uncharacterized protein {ECO:0000313/EMBL:CCA76294.1} [Serendipita indica DSM 11827]